MWKCAPRTLHNMCMSERVKLVDGKHRRMPASYVPRIRGSLLEKVTNALLAGEWQSPEDLRAQQVGRLRTLLCHVAEYSPFHAARMAAVGLVPAQVESLEDLRRLPPMTRSELQGGFSDILSRGLPGRDTFGSDITTSGSSGVPARVRTTNTYNMVWTALTLRNHVWSNVGGDWPIAVIRYLGGPQGEAAGRPAGITRPAWGGLISHVFNTGPSSSMYIGLDLAAQAAFLAKCDARMILSVSWNLVLLGDYMRDHGIRLPGLRLLHGMGEAVTDWMRERLADTFGVPFFDIYSCNELGYIASMCPDGHGYHVHDETVILEVVDDQDRPCAPGQMGRVLVTGLVNFGCPLIRYELGDDVVAGSNEPCPCGRGLSRIERIAGRTWYHLVTTDGRKLSSHPMSGMIRAAGHMRQFQVVQHTREHVEMLIVPDEGFGQEQQDHISNGLRAYLGEALRVTFSLQDEIARAPSGKQTAFICGTT